jgi:hypothetical protein
MKILALLTILGGISTCSPASAGTICGHEIPWSAEVVMQCDPVIVDQLRKDGVFSCRLFIGDEIHDIYVNNLADCPTGALHETAFQVPSSFFTPFDPVKEPLSHSVSMYIACMSKTECAKTASECATSNGVPCVPLPWRKGWPDPCGIMRCESRLAPQLN